MERVKVPYSSPEPDAGPGIPAYFIPLLHPELVDGLEPRERNSPGQISSDYKSFRIKLNLDEYKFGEEVPIDPESVQQELDVTALDRYSDDIRNYRRVIVEECRAIPVKASLDTKSLEKLEQSLAKFCRCTYYGTYKAQSIALGVVPLLVWILSRRYLPDEFRISLLKSMSEMFWSAIRLKEKLVESLGIKILFQLIEELPRNRRMANWACYTLTMSATACPEIIRAAVSIARMEELLAELSFEMYWFDWPVNFGMVLQGVLYGPRSVSANEDAFQFL